MRNKILNIINSKITITDSEKFIFSKIKKKNSLFLALNANKLSINKSEFWSKITTSFNVIGYIDGIGAKIRLSLFSWKRISGVDLWLKIFDNLPFGYRVTIYGADEQINNEVCKKLVLRRSDIELLGINGYVSDDVLISNLKEFNPNFIFIALGSPSQEIKSIYIKQKLNSNFSIMGVGGSFDVYSGRVKRSPVIISKLGLEGFWRILNDPKKRIKNFKYIYLMFLTKCSFDD